MASSNARSYVRATLLRGRRLLIQTAAVGVTATATLEWTTHLPSQGRSADVYRQFVDDHVTPALRRWLDPESACVFIAIVSIVLIVVVLVLYERSIKTVSDQKAS